MLSTQQGPKGQRLSQLFQELKRRNVFRVAIAYLAVAWLALQLADIVLDNVTAPEWVMQVLMLFIIIGFPVALIFAWAFEMTPEGIKREHEVDRSVSITGKTGRKLNFVIIGVLGIAVAFLLFDKFGEDDAPVTDKSVAVLPFIAMSSGPDDEYFADGLTEEILNSLAGLPDLLVTARTSAFHFKGQDIPPIPEIAAILGVAHIVEGSVRRDGERLRVTAQLIRAADGFHLWSENYNHDTKDTFAVQTDIAEKIATALDVVLDKEQLEKMHAVGLRDPEAYVAYQKGVELFEIAHDDLNDLDILLEANAWFEKALELAPDLSDAYLHHADYSSHVLLNASVGGETAEEDLAAAANELEHDFQNALRTAPDETHRLDAAFDLAYVSGDWRRLPPMLDKIVKLSDCTQPGWVNNIALAHGRAADVLALGERLIDCDPLSSFGWSDAVQASNWLGDFDAAITTAERGLEVTSSDTVRNHLVLAYIGAGRFDEADAIINRDIHQGERSLRLRISLAAARGDAHATTVLVDQHRNASHVFEITVLARAGKRELANQKAAEADASLYGHMALATNVLICTCGAPFDLEATPNFAKLLQDADLPWPPDSPINWPLKDW
jgi:TolB-like protein